MREREAASILLVRSIEEVDETAFSPDLVADAFKEAGPNVGQASWFVIRADYLLRQFHEWREAVLSLSQFPENAPSWILLGVFLAGLAMNYLGPPGKIHVLYNPIMALVAWNVTLLALVLLVRLTKTFRDSLQGEGLLRKPKPSESLAANGATISPGQETAQISAKAPSSPQVSTHSMGEKKTKLPWLLRVALRPIWESLVVRVMQHRQRAGDAYTQSRIIGRFWTHWSQCAHPLILSRWKRWLHLSAVSVALGAVAGMYLRGLVFDYNVIWTSTFIKDEATISGLINVLFGPAQLVSRLLGLGLESDVHASRLASSDGDPAAAWIHLFSILAMICVVLPRIGLALHCRARTKKLEDQITVNFDEYFVKIIQSQIGRVIRQEVRVVGAQLADEIAGFVRDNLYDELIVPELRSFRENGGSLNRLKERIRQICEAFEPELNSYKDTAVTRLERTLGAKMERVAAGLTTDFGMGKLVSENVVTADRVAVKEVEHAVGFMGRSFTDAASLAVSASVAVALGTISGGFGNALGTAILAALLGTTGPVGFLIGAIVGLMVAGAGWWFGREKMTQAIERMELPATVVQTCLWTSRLDSLIVEGRARCYESVKKHMSDLMEPLVPKIADEIWIRIGKT